MAEQIADRQIEVWDAATRTWFFGSLYDVDGAGALTVGDATAYKGESGPSAADFNKLTGITGGAIQTQLDAKAPKASPALTGVPTAPTAAAGTNTTQLATTQYVRTEVANLVNAAPGTLDTLKELADAIGDDPNFAASTATALGNRLRVDTGAQGLTAPQKDNARTNLGLATADSPSFTGLTVSGLTASRVVVTDGAKALASSAVTATELGYVSGVTGAIQTQLDAKQPLDTTLTALAAYATVGLVTMTAADTFTGRTLQQPAAGLTITNPAGTAGDPTFALANDLAALEGLAATGIAVRTAADTWAQRTITGTANQVVVTNGSGAAGNPTLALPQDIATASVPTFGGAIFNGLQVGGTTVIDASRNAAFVNIAQSGVMTLTGSNAFPGAASANAFIYHSATLGLVMYGAGSTDDFILSNKNGLTIFEVATGTTVPVFASNILLGASGSALLIRDASTGWTTASTTVLTPMSGNAVRSTSFTSGLTGWGINAAGDAEFNNLRARGEIASSVFKISEITATAGTQIWTVSGAALSASTTTAGSVGGSFTFTAKNSDAGGMLFAVNDIVRLKSWTGSAVSDSWATVTARTNNGATTTYTATLSSGSTSATFTAGTGTIDYGASGSPFISLSADGAIGNAPNLTMATHSGSPWSGFTTLVRLGNLNNTYGYASNVYGFAAGQYGTAGQSWVTVEQTNGIRLGSNVTTRVQLNPNGSGFLANSNISWDTSGNLTVAGSATLAGWTVNSTYINSGSTYLASGFDNPATTTSFAWFGRASAASSNYTGIILNTWDSVTSRYILMLSGLGSVYPYLGINDGTQYRVIIGGLNNVWNTGDTSTNDMGMRIWDSSGNKIVEFASTGNTIASVNIAATKMYIGTGTFNNTNTAFYVDNAGQFSLKDKLSFNGTTLTINGGGTFSGALSAATGSFSGSVTATSGAIGGWTITSTYLAKDTGTDATSSGMAPADYPFFAGSTYANRATATFRVTPAGLMTATNADITGNLTTGGGNVTLDSNGITLLSGNSAYNWIKWKDSGTQISVISTAYASPNLDMHVGPTAKTADTTGAASVYLEAYNNAHTNGINLRLVANNNVSGSAGSCYGLLYPLSAIGYTMTGFSVGHTNTPTAMLDVNGGGLFRSGSVTLGTPANTTGILNIQSGRANLTSATSLIYLGYIATTNYVGFNFQGVVATDMFFGRVPSGDDLVISTANVGSPAELVRFKQSGNVGIGTNAPLQKLQIGTNTPTGTATPDSISLGATYSTTAGANPKFRFYDDNAGAVYGIGISASAYEFQAGTGATYFWYTGGAVKMKVSSTGGLTLSTYGAGNLLADASGNITSSSDMRLKHWMGDFTRGLASIRNIVPILYRWESWSGMETETVYAGLSAQNIGAPNVIPEAVMAHRETGLLSMQDRPILAALCNAVREVDDLRLADHQEVVALRAEVALLRQHFKNL
jgi:hypothetical protein